jgi:2-aminoadipate transaminase
MTQPLSSVSGAHLQAERPYVLSQRAQNARPSAVREILKIAERSDILSFAGGLPAPELFPVDAIAEAQAKVLRDEPRLALQYSSTEGVVPLRQWITTRMRSLGQDVDIDSVLITTGSQQGIDLAARVLLDPGTVIAVENPSYLAALQAFSSYGADYATIASDEDGMRMDDLERQVLLRGIRVLYLVPNFQNPKGTTLSLARRHQLIDLASRHGLAIIEDDPYGELRFAGDALPSLASLDSTRPEPERLVIRLGSFSKTLAPGLRIGFATGPRELIRAMTVAKQSSDLQTGTLSQRVTARLLQDFDFDAHLAKLTQVYGQRCDAMLQALDNYMPTGTRWTHPQGGMFVWVELPRQLRAEDLFPHAIANKVAFVPGSGFFAGDRRHEFMRLNFSNCPTGKIAEGMTRLGIVIRGALARPPVDHQLQVPESLSLA